MLHLSLLLLLPIIEASSVWDPAPCLDKCPELSEPVALLEALVFSPPLTEAALSGGSKAGYEALRDDQQYSCVAEKLCGTCREISTCNLGRCINDHVECRRLTDFTSELVKICYCSIGYDIGFLSEMIDPRWSADPPPCESSLPDGTADNVAASCRDFDSSEFLAGVRQEPIGNEEENGAERSSRLAIFVIIVIATLPFMSFHEGSPPTPTPLPAAPEASQAAVPSAVIEAAVASPTSVSSPIPQSRPASAAASTATISTSGAKVRLKVEEMKQYLDQAKCLFADSPEKYDELLEVIASMSKRTRPRSPSSSPSPPQPTAAATTNVAAAAAAAAASSLPATTTIAGGSGLGALVGQLQQLNNTTGGQATSGGGASVQMLQALQGLMQHPPPAQTPAQPQPTPMEIARQEDDLSELDNLDVGALIDRLLKVFEGQGAAKSMVLCFLQLCRLSNHPAASWLFEEAERLREAEVKRLKETEEKEAFAAVSAAARATADVVGPPGPPICLDRAATMAFLTAVLPTLPSNVYAVLSSGVYQGLEAGIVNSNFDEGMRRVLQNYAMATSVYLAHRKSMIRVHGTNESAFPSKSSNTRRLPTTTARGKRKRAVRGKAASTTSSEENGQVSSEETSAEAVTVESDEGTDPSLPPSRPTRGRKRRAAAAVLPSTSEASDDDAVPKRRSTRRTRSRMVKAETTTTRRGGGVSSSSSSSEKDSLEHGSKRGRQGSRKRGASSALLATAASMPSAAQRLAEKSTMGGRERVALEMLAALLPPTLAHELYKTISIWLAGGFEVSTVSTFLGRILSHLKSCTTVPSIVEEEGGDSPSGAEAQQKYDAIFDIYTEQERTVLLNRLRELDHAVVEVCNRHLVDLINGALLKREAAKQREVMKEAPKAEGCRSYLNHLSFPGESAEAAVCRERLLRTPPGIINNTWMGVSLGTEEAQDFKYFRRNHSEEALFNNEDHKYATTFTVKCVSLTVRRLEELQKKLEEMAEGEREAYELKMPHDITSQHLEQIINSYTSTAIGQKMADELLLHPMKTLPLLVTRLKETEASLTSPTSGLVAAASKAWLKVDKRSYLPGLDHRSYYFRGHCSKNSTSRAFLTDLRQSDSPLGIVEEEREWASWGPEWLSKSDSGRYPITIIGNAATFQSLQQDGVANGAEPAAQGPPVLLCMPNAEIHELALKLVKGKVEARWAEEPVDGISIDMALHTLDKILQPFLPASAELKSPRPSNGTKIFDDVTTLKGQEQSSSRPVFLTQTQYSLLRYYHIIYSRLARAASDIARLKKQLEHQQQQQGQEESITSESPQSLPGGGGDNNTLSTDGNNVVTTVPGSQGVDSLVNSIVETFLSSSDPTGMGGFNNIVREHLGFNRGYYLYTMPKVLARMSEALQLVCLGRADVVSKRKTSDSGSRVPRRDSATQRLFALNESIQSVDLNSETAKELSILGLECYRHYNYYDAGPDPEGLGGSIIAASVHDDGWFSCCELKA